MRWNEIGGLLVRYGSIVLIAAAVALIVIVLMRWWRKRRRRKAWKSTWQLKEEQDMGKNAVRTVALALLIGYGLALVAVTMISRGNMTYESVSLQPLAAYRSAWRTMDLRQWQMIGLNILMFVPLGFLLPLAFSRLRSIWKTMAVGVAVTLLVEFLQKVTGRGILEFDDLLNNAWGCLAGYCFFSAAASIVESIGHKEMFSDYEKNVCKRRAATALALALSPAAVFGAIYMVYEQQEFGNLNFGNSARIRAAIRWEEDVQTGTGEAGLPQEAYIYSTTVYTAEEAEDQAAKIARNAGFEMEPVRSDVYSDNALYHFENAAGETMSIWVYYEGGLYRAYFFDVEYDTDAFGERTALSGTAAKKRLRDSMGISVPDGARLTLLNQPGQYRWDVDQTGNGSKGGKLGSLELTLNAAGDVWMVDNTIYDLSRFEMVELASVERLTEKMSRGQYRMDVYNTADLAAMEVALGDGTDGEGVLTVTSAELTYEKDTKGFLRPVARLTVTIGEGGESGEGQQQDQWKLLVPAE